MISFPNAKINLGLNIVSKREDGYHDIESCFYPIKWHDSLEIVEASSFSFYSYGLKIPGDTSNNLCVKAYNLLKADFELPPIAIHLLKNIPMGAGLGGGSADGAFILKLLNDFFKLDLSDKQLENYALSLGSDCPFFIKNEPAIAKGRGELLEPFTLDLSGYLLAIHNPEIHISTKAAYSKIQPAKPIESIATILNSPISEWQNQLINDFEKPILMDYPSIKSLKKDMLKVGAIYASMTGSGSTVYGIFTEKINEKWRWITL